MPKKRSNGEGALRKRQNGLWECMIMTGFQPNGKRKYKSFYARTQREVLQKVKVYQTAIDSGLDVTKREPTFAEWAQTWYEGYREQVSPTTYEGYGYTLKTLNKAFGAMPLRNIKAADVEAFLRDLTADGKHQSQASKCRGMMFQIMRKAQANDLILKNPVELADKTRQKPQKSKRTPSQRKKSKSYSNTCRMTRPATAYVYCCSRVCARRSCWRSKSSTSSRMARASTYGRR